MTDQVVAEPDHTAVRTALWRALHVEADASPHVIEDLVGLRIAAPGDDWRQRGDMDAEGTKVFRGGIVARARFVEDVVTEQAARGVRQYVILGAGLDTFAQRRPELAATLRVFEVDQPGPQRWKHQRLIELGYGIPDWLNLVPVDFEADSWWERLLAAGFDPARPAVVSSLGVSMYLTRDAMLATLRQVAALAAGSTLVTTFQRPLELIEPDSVREIRAAVEKAAAASGTPFISFYSPAEIQSLAREAGFATATHIGAEDLTARYFAHRTDGLIPVNAEELILATT